MHLIPNKIDEDQYRDEINHQIREYFKKSRYTVIDLPSSRREKKVSYDVLFGNGNKIFGFQYKKPYQNKTLGWTIDRAQYDKIQETSYIYYCLPDFVERDLLPTAIHHALFSKLKNLKNKFNSHTHKIHKKDFRGERWGTFSKKIISCKYGKIIKKETPVFSLISVVKQKGLSLYTINVQKKIFALLDKSIIYKYF